MGAVGFTYKGPVRPSTHKERELALVLWVHPRVGVAGSGMRRSVGVLRGVTMARTLARPHGTSWLVLATVCRHAAVFCSVPSSPLPSPPSQQQLPPPHPATIDPKLLLLECDVKRTRGSGPGGQHRNKVETAIVISHSPTGVTGSASEARSQQVNLAKATFRLRMKLALTCRTEQGSAAILPSACWASRRRKGKFGINEEHDDFPALISEALDWVWWSEDVKAASEGLGVSTSQLVKLFAKEPAALRLVNDLRAASGLGPLRARR